MSRTIPAAFLSFFVGIGGMHGASLVATRNGPPPDTKSTENTKNKEQKMKEEAKNGDGLRLGNFSVSLTVKDIAASRAFYEKLGFKAMGGDQAQGWLVMQNDSATIGIFQGMFPRNMLTFNPGWDRSAQPLTEFDDVREIQRMLRAQGIEPEPAADESSTGTAYIMITDPDGNPILIDQHVPKPGA
ncbi:MAG: VOC family protein [Phycisphaeraceae bacterium]|nr:VOC family protein [Phycisphaeraceae bacterium]QYK47982.1 MAG: VOC family protein [Phycisphaeraceae bacterium]